MVNACVQFSFSATPPFSAAAFHSCFYPLHFSHHFISRLDVLPQSLDREYTHTRFFFFFFFSFFRLAEHQPTPPLSTTDEQGQNSSVYVDHTDTAVRSQLRRLHSEMFSVPIYQKLSGLSLSFAYRRPPPPSHHHNVFRPNSFFNFHSDDEWMP